MGRAMAAAMVGLMLCGAGPAQEPAKSANDAGKGLASVTFKFERPGVPVPRFRMIVREDGSGRYQAEEVVGGGTEASPSVGAGAPMTVDRAVTISPATTARIFKTARSAKNFTVVCASKAKNIADTGTKTLTFEGPDGGGTCVYNYTEDKGISMLTETFIGIAETLDEGRKLEFKRRYDRLGLDAELATLAKLNEDGRAIELVTITPTLEQMASDAELMQRVRLRASKLLERAGDGK